MNKAVSALALALAQAVCLLGGEIIVTTGPELTSAINDAAVAYDPTTIIVVGTLEGPFTVPETKQPIIIIGQAETSPTLDGQQLGTTLTVELGATVALKNLTITNGKNESVQNGGGISNFGSMYITRCKITYNTSSSSGIFATLYGGAIYNNNEMTIKDSCITNNTADRGGGIYNRNVMTIIGSKINNNTQSPALENCYGGGVYNNGYLKVFSSTISSNTAPNGYAAGVYTEGKMYIKDSTISNNVAAFNTGGIENDISLTIDHCKIYGNVAQNGIGGGVYNDYGTMTIKHSSIHNNMVHQGDGAGIFNAWDLLVIHSSIADNQATNGDGGGIYNNWVMEVINSHIHDNNAPVGSGGGIFNGPDGNIQNPLATIKCTDIKNNTASFGGGIANEGGSLLELFNTQVTKNIATAGPGGGGGIFNPSPSELVIKKSKVSKNIWENIFPPL